MLLSQLIGTGSDVRALAQRLDVPVLAGLQHQGDVSVIPAAMITDYVRPRRPVPAAGVAVVRGEATGNTHLLLAAGRVLFDHVRAAGITLGYLLVDEGAEAYLDHPEHGDSGIAPGRYALRRKRETAGGIHLVHD